MVEDKVKIKCYNCDEGYTITHEYSGFPEKERCQLCDGTSEIYVTKAFARMMGYGDEHE